MEADYKLGGCWGNHIDWLDVDWDNANFNKDLFTVMGHMPRKPRVGDTLVAEFTNSFTKFVFVEVTYPGQPTDMFFGKVKAIDQELKGE